MSCLRMLETCIVFSMPSCTGTGAKCHQVCFQAHLTSKLFDHYALGVCSSHCPGLCLRTDHLSPWILSSPRSSCIVLYASIHLLPLAKAATWSTAIRWSWRISNVRENHWGRHQRGPAAPPDTAKKPFDYHLFDID